MTNHQRRHVPIARPLMLERLEPRQLLSSIHGGSGGQRHGEHPSHHSRGDHDYAHHYDRNPITVGRHLAPPRLVLVDPSSDLQPSSAAPVVIAVVVTPTPAMPVATSATTLARLLESGTSAGADSGGLVDVVLDEPVLRMQAPVDSEGESERTFVSAQAESLSIDVDSREESLLDRPLVDRSNTTAAWLEADTESSDEGDVPLQLSELDLERPRREDEPQDADLQEPLPEDVALWEFLEEQKRDTPSTRGEARPSEPKRSAEEHLVTASPESALRWRPSVEHAAPTLDGHNVPEAILHALAEMATTSTTPATAASSPAMEIFMLDGLPWLQLSTDLPSNEQAAISND